MNNEALVSRSAAAVSSGPLETGETSTPDSDTVVEDTVERIIRAHRASSLQLALDVGAIVVDGLYGGDLEKLRARGRKGHSLRRLASHPRLPFSAATLWRCIGVYAVVREAPELVRFEHLTLAHFRAVLALPPERRNVLLLEAATAKRSVAWVAREAGTERRLGSCTPGSEKKLISNVRQVEKAARGCRIPAGTGPFALSPHEKSAIRTQIKTIREWCREVDEWLNTNFESSAS